MSTRSGSFWRRCLLCALLALLPAAILPVYPRRSMTRSFTTGSGGDRIRFGFEFSTLPGFFAARRYMRPEESPDATTIANVVFWISIAGSCGLAAAWFWSWQRTRSH